MCRALAHGKGRAQRPLFQPLQRSWPAAAMREREIRCPWWRQALRVGRAQHQQAKRGRGAVDGAHAQRQQGNGLRSRASQPAGSTQVGAAERHGERRGEGPGIVTGAQGKVAVDVGARHPHTRTAAWGTSNRAHTPSTTVGGRSMGSRTCSRLPVHWCTFWAMASSRIVAHHLPSRAVPAPDLLAQHFGLALLQAHGTLAVGW